ncbi:hypothetical protein BSZ36_17740 [Rubricoccus marinus]|uniref:Metallo-beta-lactamase domain-containing protein n=2 Tax=Rubricoccus marinus TaxID=716817 RepID=A0A259TUB1_9BACT|nr:hypothetical protein BSZ36_17740 [Rubricoccus marinus]
MYDPGGLGDCFLLAFPGPGGDDRPARYVLVDCGVFNGTRGGSKQMRNVAADVVAVTGGRIDVLVLSHEHWDHLSGFQWARETFENDLQIDEVWAAWTEDPADPDAVRLQRELDADFGTLQLAASRLREARDPHLRARADEIGGVLGFLGVGASKAALRTLAAVPDRFAAKRSRGTAKQMDLALSLGDHARYLSPGEAPVPVAPGVRAFVLGPPRNEALLRRSDPRRHSGEVYEHAAAETARTRDGLADALADDDPSAPFGPDTGVPLGDASTGDLADFVLDHYGGDEPPPELAWRRIDEDWLGTAEALALQLDGDVNNTSLALAFELADGRVLLFPGDAQVGNWLSWHELSWDDDGQLVTAETLLGQTVLYKVGHHASHNATLRDLGLELMSHPDLTALVPVNEAQARKKKWAMPFAPLDARLQERCSGRVLRADTKVPDRPAGVSQRTWQSFLGRVSTDPDGLWVQVEIE